MADNISNIVDSSVIPELQALIDKLTQVEKAIASASDEAKNIKVNIQGAENLATITTQIEKISSSIDNLTQVQIQNKSAIAQLEIVTQNYGIDATEAAKKIAELNNILDYQTKNLNSVSNALAKGSGDIANLTEQQHKYTLEVEKTKIELKEYQDALRSEIKLKNLSTQETQANTAATIANKNAIKAATDEISGKKDAANAKMIAQAAERERKEVLAATGSAQKQIEQAERAERAQVLAATASAQKQIEQAERAERAQVLAATRVAERQEVAANKSIWSWENFTKIFERQGLRMVASMIWWGAIIGAATALYEWFNKISDAEERANNRLDDYKNKIQELKKLEEESEIDILKNEKVNQTDFNALLKYYQDSTNAVEKRAAAYAKMQELYPNFLKNLTEEQKLGKEGLPYVDPKAATAFNKAKTEFEQSQKDKDASLDAEAATYKTLVDLQDKRNKLLLEGNSIRASVGSKAIIGFQLIGVDSDITKAEKEYELLKKSREEKLKDYNDKYKAYQDLQVLDEKNKKTPNHTNPLSPLEPNLAGGKKYNNALHELIKQQLLFDAESNKEIVNDTNKSLQERLDANMRYYHVLAKLVHNETERQIDEQAEVIKNAEAKKGSLQSQLLGLEKGYGGKTKQFNKDANVKILQERIKDQVEIINSGKILMIKAESQASNELEKNQEVTQENIYKIFDTNGKKILDNQDKVNTEMQSRNALMAAQEITQLVNKLNKKEITQEEYHNRTEAINKKFRKQQLEAEVKQYTDLLAVEGENRLIGASRTKAESALGKAQSSLNDLNAGGLGGNDTEDMSALGKLFYNAFNTNEIDKEKIKKQQKEAEDAAAQAIELASKTASAIQTIKDNEFAHEQDLLNKEKQSIQFQAEQRINSINASVGYEIQKKNELSIVNAQTAARVNEINIKEQELAIRKAKFDRTAAEAQIIMSTEVAEANALSLLGNVLTEPFYPAIAALIAATGAAEFAAASSAPIPTYRYGTTATTTPTFIAGEAGENELITRPDGSSYWSGTKAKLFREPLGTSVTPLSKIQKFAEDSITNSLGVNSNAISFALSDQNKTEGYKILADTFGSKIEQLSDDIVGAIQNIPQPQQTNIADIVRMETMKHRLKGL